MTLRLNALLSMIEQLDEDEMRLLPSVLGNKLMEKDRGRARALKPHVGAQCNVDWPEQADLFAVRLVSVDEEKGIVQVSTTPGQPVWSVPPYCIRLI